jgi:hypothetical protein
MPWLPPPEPPLPPIPPPDELEAPLLDEASPELDEAPPEPDVEPLPLEAVEEPLEVAPVVAVLISDSPEQLTKAREEHDKRAKAERRSIVDMASHCTWYEDICEGGKLVQFYWKIVLGLR